MVETGVEGGFVRRVPQAKVVVPFLLFYSMTIKATKVRLSAMSLVNHPEPGQQIAETHLNRTPDPVPRPCNFGYLSFLL